MFTNSSFDGNYLEIEHSESRYGIFVLVLLSLSIGFARNSISVREHCSFVFYGDFFNAFFKTNPFQKHAYNVFM